MKARNTALPSSQVEICVTGAKSTLTLWDGTYTESTGSEDETIYEYDIYQLTVPTRAGLAEAGFLNGFDADFIAVLGAPVKRTARNTFTDGGGYIDISTDIMFLLSHGEIGGTNENSINEGAPYEFYDNMLINHVRNDGELTGRIKYLSGSPRNWWLRSPNASNSISVRIVGTSGGVNSNRAYSAYGVAPACCIRDADEFHKLIGSGQVTIIPYSDSQFDNIPGQRVSTTLYLDEPLRQGDTYEVVGGKITRNGVTAYVPGTDIPAFHGTTIVSVNTVTPPSAVSAEYYIKK